MKYSDVSSEQLTEINEAGWKNDSDIVISKTFFVGSYSTVIEFANLIFKISVMLDHHPTLTIGYDTVKVVISTHEHNAISNYDYLLATVIDKALYKFLKFDE